MSDASDPSSVKVAVRIRPLVSNEVSRGCKEIVDVIEEHNQVVIRSIDKDKSFTFNYVLPSYTPQEELYDRCVKPIIGNIFKGYNVTILAYGQTGSGKTHSMGTAYRGEEDMGVIPRAVNDIFMFVRDNFSYDFTITVSFIELYQEVLYDLLSNKTRDQCILDIREDVVKGIHIPGLTEMPVQTAAEVLDILQKGSMGRVTGATAMNAQSSRSHAIITVNISMNQRDNCLENKQAKLHLVDLAGSERPKKTGAVGNTFKEGVNINKGLFVLGNVISCLGGEKSKDGFIPYRDSNLTRLLKDSLGGNSITLMIACVSPADYNVDETLSTLRYADRARKIKNKPIVNQDAKTAEINALKKTIQQLRLQIISQGGPIICPAEIHLLKKEIDEHKVKIRDLMLQLSAALIDKTGLHEKIIILQTANEALTGKISELKEQYDITFHNISICVKNNNTDMIKENLGKLQLIQNQFVEINSEQKKTAEEIRTHEEAFNEHLMSNPSSDIETPTEVQEKQETHTTRQMALNTELIEIQKQLVLKESLAMQLASNNQHIVDYKAMADNELKIAVLQKERDELMQQLKTAQTQGVSNKVAEQRRRRVQELETQLHNLNKKVQEQARLIKLKEKDEQRINKLNQDIIQIKQTRVKLLRTMKEESDKFRQWKTEKERECQRLKQKDRKKDGEIVKMKAMYTKQQNVFKRRVEEAEALNKRLRNMLALRKQTQTAKVAGKAEKIGPWLKQEFDIFINLVEAESTLTCLLEDRATLQHQLDQLKANPETADSAECKSIEEDIELRSVQIQDLNQKILDSDEENKSKTRFDKFQSMGEAKYGLKLMFEQAAELQKDKMHLQLKLNELQESYNEVQEKMRNSEANHKAMEEFNLEQLEQLQKNYEEKVAILLSQLRGIKVENQGDGADERLEEKDRIIRELRERNRELEEYMRNNEKKDSNTDTPLVLNSTFVKKENINEEHTPIKKPQKIAQCKVRVNNISLDIEDKENSSLDEDDTENDPDWRKTPLGRRIIEEKKKMTLARSTLNFNEGPIKRSSDGGCTCKTNCLKSRCGCKKLNRQCGNSCKCLPTVCQNKKLDAEGSSMSSEVSQDNATFKRPRFLEDHHQDEDQSKRQKNKTRRLFKLEL